MSFPYHLCETWRGIEELVRLAFLHVVIVGQRVNEGHYDILNPAGEVILPQLWEHYEQPGWEISISIRPALGHPRPCYSPPSMPPNGPPNAPVHVIDRLTCPPDPPAACFLPHYPPAVCSRSHYLPGYSSDPIVPEKGIRRLWHKVKGIFIKKQTNYDSKSSGLLPGE